MRADVSGNCQAIVDNHRKKLLYQIGMTDDPHMELGSGVPKDDCYS